MTDITLTQPLTAKQSRAMLNAALRARYRSDAAYRAKRLRRQRNAYDNRTSNVTKLQLVERLEDLQGAYTKLESKVSRQAEMIRKLKTAKAQAKTVRLLAGAH